MNQNTVKVVIVAGAVLLATSCLVFRSYKKRKLLNMPVPEEPEPKKKVKRKKDKKKQKGPTNIR